MVAFLSRQGLTKPLFLAFGAALVAGALALLVPLDLLGDWSMQSGLAAIVAAAEPPLGNTARAGFAFAVATGVGAFAWTILTLLSGIAAPRRRRSRSAPDVIALGDANVPQVRRADAHPDAPPRAPVRANRDLGMPFLEVHAPREEDDLIEDEVEVGAAEPVAAEEMVEAEAEVEVAAESAPVHTMPVPVPPLFEMPEEQDIPADLDVPLSQLDPVSFNEIGGRTPRRPRERIETFELTPPVRLSAPPRPRPVPRAPVEAPQPEERLAAPRTEATIHALLARLEQGIADRGLVPEQAAETAEPEPNPHRIQNTLSELRRMAARS